MLFRVLAAALVGVALLAGCAAGLAENVRHSGSGLKYVILEEGTGNKALPGRQVAVHYTGWLEDGTQFDSSIERGQPFIFPLGSGVVIKGWDEGLVGMKVGEKRKLIIPPHLAYGPGGAQGLVPPDATLIFEIELLGVK